MSQSHTNPHNSFFLNTLAVWLLIALTGLDFLSHIMLGGSYANRFADLNLWRSNHFITNSIFYVIGLWSLAKLCVNPQRLKHLLHPILLLFFTYSVVVAISLVYLWPFKLPIWDDSQTYPITMVLRLFCFFFAVAAMHSTTMATLSKSLNPYTVIQKLWNIILGFFVLRLCIVWLQNFMLRFPSNTANPETQTQDFVTQQLNLLFSERLWIPIRAQGVEFPFFYGPLNANESALLAIILFCTSVIRLINYRKKRLSIFQLLIWMFICLLSLLTIIFTQASTVLILFIICIPLLAIFNKRTDVIAIAMSAIAIFALTFDQPVQNKFNEFFGRGNNVIERVTDLGGRRYIWQKAWTHIKEKPILGHGYETNRFVIDRPLKNIEPYNNPDVLHAHNTYISVLVENGIVGLVPLVLAIILLWSSCIKKLRTSNYSPLSQEMLFLLIIMTFSSLAYIGFFNSILIIYRWLMLIPLLLFAMLPHNTNLYIEQEALKDQ